MKQLLFSFIIGMGSFLFFVSIAFGQNVGIGTSNPAFKLDVKNGSINTDSLYRIGGAAVLSASPTFNTLAGIGSGGLITTGVENTATGSEALYFNNLGSRNTATGRQTLYYNNGNYNTAHGIYALYYNGTASFNTANGSWALYFNTGGENNTAMGYQAAYPNTTGRNNTAVGYQALFHTETSVGVTAIGTFADVQFSQNLEDATAIGYNAKVDQSNKVRIGSITVTSIGGPVGWSTFSDGRYKRNVKENVPGISFIKKLRPVTYTVDLKSLDENYYKLTTGIGAAANTSYLHTGFVAQEVEQSAMELGFNFNGVDKPQRPEGLYALRYAEFVVPLVKAVQEQQQQIEDLKKEVELLKAMIKNR